jgi:hypothetical protein
MHKDDAEQPPIYNLFPIYCLSRIVRSEAAASSSSSSFGQGILCETEVDLLIGYDLLLPHAVSCCCNHPSFLLHRSADAA